MVAVAMLSAGAAVTIHTQMLDVTIVQVRVLGTAVAGGLAALVLTLNFFTRGARVRRDLFYECVVYCTETNELHTCKVGVQRRAGSNDGVRGVVSPALARREYWQMGEN